jgi:Ankyrin repeats (many copies)
VEYNGLRGVPVRGRRTAAIPPESVAAILQEMQDAKFMSFDDKTFAKVSDNGDVIVSLSFDGRNKTVGSSQINESDRPQETLEKFLGKAQMRFLKLADKIDSLIGTDHWTKCSPNCEKLLYVLSLERRRDPNWSPNLVSVIQSNKPFTLGSMICDAETIVEAGVDVDAPDRQGETPLMAAAGNGDAELVRNLLAHGATPEARDKKGRTALEYTSSPEVKSVLATGATGK